MRKAVISAIAFAVVAPMSFLSNTSLAHAAAPALSTCYASSCTGHPAASYTCVKDAEVIYSVNIMYGSTVVGNVQLKYSPSCRATWARVISNLYYGSIAAIQNTNNYLLYEHCTGTGGAGTGCNTNMIDDLNPLQSYAYGEVNMNIGVSGPDAYTPDW